jgi:hypothetical protein
VAKLQAKTKPADIINPTTHARKTLFNEKIEGGRVASFLTPPISHAGTGGKSLVKTKTTRASPVKEPNVSNTSVRVGM